MSIQAMVWAMDQEIVASPTARHVLLVLANYADVNGKAAFPSADTLVRQTGLSERAVRNKLAEMEELGVITRGNQAVVQAYIDRGDRRPISYDLAMPQEEKRGASGAPRKQRGARGSVTGCTSFQDGVHVVPERGAPRAPNTSFNPSINPSVNQEHTDAARPTRSQRGSTTKTVKTELPTDFAISERVRAWAAGNGHTQLEQHFAAFVTKARANGYRYASWDDAFMEAVRADWAQLSRRGGHQGSRNDRSAAAAAIFPTRTTTQEYIDV
ncbi:helix-turn-helix domain-containing protein [Paraburkholderia diazotrophica]|uniref:Helix-turn-helix domain-containing protein n=1 Tax=Paraburkholderia diazotrophica TaxID=667676 RepID=A0A1H6QE94_9BURK|nr:helix-turn-helix domain-containing protein [Paraburkholderia diazotrophica]SEI42029.1 Helix-turn-helix domain-containing protein [Paraburkholderia diazotrophica]